MTALKRRFTKWQWFWLRVVLYWATILTAGSLVFADPITMSAIVSLFPMAVVMIVFADGLQRWLDRMSQDKEGD